MITLGSNAIKVLNSFGVDRIEIERKGPRPVLNQDFDFTKVRTVDNNFVCEIEGELRTIAILTDALD